MKYIWKETKQVIDTEAELIKKIRSLGVDPNNELSDSFLIDESWQLDEFEDIEEVEHG